MTRRRTTLYAVSLAVLLGLGLHALLTPAVARADDCVIMTLDLCSFSDSVTLRVVQIPLMETLWTWNRRALLGARWLEGLHAWLADNVLATALTVVIGKMKLPFWLAVATAVILAVVTFLAQVVLVRVRLVNLPRAIAVVLLAVFLFKLGIPAIAAVEHVRVGLVAGFAGVADQVAEAVGSPFFYVSADKQAPTLHAIYTGDPCKLGTERVGDTQVHLNDLMANSLWAEAEDIHCPPPQSSRPNLPTQFMTGDGKDFPGYLPVYPLSYQDQAERGQLLAAINTGTNQLVTALLTLTPAAILEPLWNLLLLGSLATIGLALVVSLPAGLFVPLQHLLGRQIEGLVAVFQTSALSSFWIGLVAALLRLAARSGSPDAVAILGVVASVVLGWQCIQAGMLAFRTLAVSAEGIGVSIGELGKAGTGTARAVGQSLVNGGLVAAAAATGGVGALAGQMLRRGLMTAGSGATSRAAGRELVHEIDRWAADDRSYTQERQQADQVAWYARRRGEGAALAPGTHQRAAAAERDLVERELRRIQQQAEQARARGAYGHADRLEAAVARRRVALGGQPVQPDTARSAPSSSSAWPARSLPRTPSSSPGAAPARPCTPDHHAVHRRRIAALRARQFSGGVR